MDDTAEGRMMRGLARIYRIVNNRIVEEEYHPAITTSGFSLSLKSGLAVICGRNMLCGQVYCVVCIDSNRN